MSIVLPSPESGTEQLPPSISLPPVFKRLLIAWSASLTADGMRFAAIPLLALATHPTPASVSAVAAAMALPWLLISLPAGALVDRLDPAKVIAAANIARAVASGLLVLAIVAGLVNIPLLCGVGFTLTAAETFADSAAQSLLVRIVPSGELERGNARFVSSENVALDLAGPLLAGALFSIATWLPFAVSALLFVLTAGAMLTLTGHRDNPERSTTGRAGLDSGSDPSTGSSLADGFRVIFRDPGLRALVITVAVMVAAIAAMEAVLVLYSANSLHLSPALYPTLLACYSIGLLVSAAFVARLTRRFPAGTLMLLAIGGFGVTLVALGLFPHPVIAWLCFALMGASGGVWNVLSATRRQRRTPRSMLARVSSTFRALTWGALPIGATLGGLGGEQWGVPMVFVVAGGVVLLLGCLVGPSFLRPEGPLPEPELETAPTEPERMEPQWAGQPPGVEAPQAQPTRVAAQRSSGRHRAPSTDHADVSSSPGLRPPDAAPVLPSDERDGFGLLPTQQRSVEFAAERSPTADDSQPVR